MLRHLRLCALLCAIPMLTTVAQSPGDIRIPDRIDCARCDIRVRLAERLALPDSSPYASPIGATRDARGAYWVFRVDVLPQVFDAKQSTRLTFGREGRGPGELLAPTELLAVANDSFLVLDGRNLRGTVYDALKRPARTVSVPFRINRAIVLRWPDSLVVSARIATPASVGLPLHLVSLAGATAWVRESFGSADAEVRPGEVRRDFVELHRGRREVWSASRFDYRITSWPAVGRARQSFVRRPTWFPSTAEGGIGWVDRPPSPHVAAMRVDADDLIWVYTAVPSASWRDAWPKVASGASEVDLRNVAIERLYDTVVEVIDPRVARVLTRRRIHGYVVSVMPDGKAARFTVTDEGVQVVEILEVDVIGRRGRR